MLANFWSLIHFLGSHQESLKFLVRLFVLGFGSLLKFGEFIGKIIRVSWIQLNRFLKVLCRAPKIVYLGQSLRSSVVCFDTFLEVKTLSRTLDAFSEVIGQEVTNRQVKERGSLHLDGFLDLLFGHFIVCIVGLLADHVEELRVVAALRIAIRDQRLEESTYTCIFFNSVGVVSLLEVQVAFLFERFAEFELTSKRLGQGSHSRRNLRQATWWGLLDLLFFLLLLLLRGGLLSFSGWSAGSHWDFLDRACLDHSG